MTETSAYQSAYQGKTILITGASGYIGASLTKALSDVQCLLVLSSRQSVTPPPTSTAECVTVNGDVTDSDFWDRACDGGVDTVFHLAAQTNLYESKDHPLEDLEINAKSLLRFLERARRDKKSINMIVASTATVTGITDNDAGSETQFERPLSIYDTHKLIMEHYLRIYVAEGWVKGASLRLANVYGPSPGMPAVDRGVVNAMIARGLDNQSLPIYRPGTWVRDYIYIDDVIAAFLAAGSNADKLDGAAYGIGSGQGESLEDTFKLIIDRVQAVTGETVALEFVDAPENLNPIEFRNHVAETAAFSELSGWLPQVLLQDGIDRTIAAFGGEI